MCTFNGVITINKVRFYFEFNNLLIINPFKPEIYLNYIHTFSSYLTEDTIYFHYKDSLLLIKLNAAHSPNYYKHTSTLYRQNIELYNATAGSTYINNCALKSYYINMTVIIYFNRRFLGTKGNNFRYTLTI